MPIYYGCTNIEEYFDSRSYFQIDIKNPESALALINYVFQSDPYDLHIDAIRSSKHDVLNKYNFFAAVSDVFDLLSAPKTHQVSRTIRPRRNTRSVVEYARDGLQLAARKILNVGR